MNPVGYHPEMQLVRAFLITILLLALPRLNYSEDRAERPITKLLDEQVEAWNHSDLAKFVAGYADHCTLVGSNDIKETTRAQVLAHYQHKYPSPEAMGKLSFSALSIRPIGGDAVIATGRWHLERNVASGGNASGVFSLVLRLMQGTWQIVLDHTS